MPVSSFGYVLGLLIKSMFIVIEAYIDARNLGMMPKNPVSTTSLDTSFDTDKRYLL
jgi:hypothetical protein